MQDLFKQTAHFFAPPNETQIPYQLRHAIPTLMIKKTGQSSYFGKSALLRQHQIALKRTQILQDSTQLVSSNQTITAPRQIKRNVSAPRNYRKQVLEPCFTFGKLNKQDYSNQNQQNTKNYSDSFQTESTFSDEKIFKPLEKKITILPIHHSRYHTQTQIESEYISPLQDIFIKKNLPRITRAKSQQSDVRVKPSRSFLLRKPQLIILNKIFHDKE